MTGPDRPSDLWLAQAQDVAKLEYWIWRHAQVSEWDPSSALAQKGARPDAPEGGPGAYFLSKDWTAHPDDSSRLHDTLRRADSERAPYRVSYRIVRPSAPARTIYEAGVPIDDPDTGAPIWIGLIQDVTEQRALEEQLVHAQKLELIGRLTGGFAHDFNNILAIVMGNLELALDRLETERPDEADAVRQALAAVDRGADLTQRLLALARKQTLKPSILDANGVIRSMTNMIRRTLQDHIELEFVSDAGLWRCEADQSQLENAVLNLIVNARDAMPNGGKLTIECSNARLSNEYAAQWLDVAPGQYVLVAVTDTGGGMPPDVLAKALEPFFSTKGAGKGSGLGLSTVYGFVKQSLGHLSIYSEVGAGTTVKVYLPRALTGQDAAGEEDVAPIGVAPSAAKILLVEDNPDLRALAQTMLESIGHTVTATAAGAEALTAAAAADQAFDLLLTDVMMPGGVDGPTLARAISEQAPGIAVLYMSGFVENAIVHNGRLDPGVHFLSKPFRKQELALAVQNCLDDVGRAPARPGR